MPMMYAAKCGVLKKIPAKQCLNCILARPLVEQPSDPSYRFIALTQGQFAIVDAGDYEWLNQWNWCARLNKPTQHYYAMRQSPRINGKSTAIYMHRVIIGLAKDDPREGDHINRETLDNRRPNLPIANQSQNAQNASLRKDNMAGFRGVCWHKYMEKWFSRIAVDGKRIHLGYFDDINEAKAAYESAALELHKDFASFG